MSHGQIATRVLPLIACGALVLALAGCGVGRVSTRPPSSDPGAGESVADRLYTAVRPRIGEQVLPPNPAGGAADECLMKRVLGIAESRAEWGVMLLAGDWDTNTQLQFSCSDGSILVLHTSLQPGSHEPPPGPDTGTRLESVQVVRP
jgi:hypothetical protein